MRWAAVLGPGRRFLVETEADRRSVFSFRGQVLPADFLLNTVDVELIYGGIKYILKVAPRVSRMSPALWSPRSLVCPWAEPRVGGRALDPVSLLPRRPCGGRMLGGRKRKEGTQLVRDGRWDHALGQRPRAPPQAGVVIGTWDQTGEAPTGLSHSGHSSSSWSGAGQLLFWGHRDKRHPDAGGDVAPVPQVARQSLTMFVLIMNGGHIEIDAHRLNDGGLLLSYDGNSYTTYMKEEVDRCVGGSQPERGSTLCPPSWLLSCLW